MFNVARSDGELLLMDWCDERTAKDYLVYYMQRYADISFMLVRMQ